MEREGENRPFIRQWDLAQHRAAIQDKNMAHLAVETVPGNEFVGYVILVGLESRDQSIEFKRIVIREKGEGFGRETVKLVKKFAFEVLKVHRVWLEVIEENSRAEHIYRSEGFVEEGVHRECLKQGEKYHTVRVLSMLEQEYVGR